MTSDSQHVHIAQTDFLFHHDLLFLCVPLFLLDLLFCYTMDVTECGHDFIFRIIVILLLVPVIMLREHRYASTFSFYVNGVSCIAIFSLLMYTISIISDGEGAMKTSYAIDLNADYILLFFGTSSALFEGNALVADLF